MSNGFGGSFKSKEQLTMGGSLGGSLGGSESEMRFCHICFHLSLLCIPILYCHAFGTRNEHFHTENNNNYNNKRETIKQKY